MNNNQRFWSAGPGEESRLRLVVAIDHGLSFPQMPGLGAPLDIVRHIAGNPQVDGIIASYGVLVQAQRLGIDLDHKTRLVVVDYVDPRENPDGTSALPQREIMVKPEEIAHSGAHCYKLFLNIYDDPRELYRNCRDLERFATYGNVHGVSTLAELMFYGNSRFRDPATRAAELLKGCRLAMELGADVLKIPSIPELEVIEEIAATIQLPIYMMGGSKCADHAEFLTHLKQLTQHPIDGLMFGRNIWQAEDLGGIIGDIYRTIQKDEVRL